MGVDNKPSGGDVTEGGGPLDVRALAAEPAQAYYARLYAEYIAAKKALGEPTEQITEQTFNARIQDMEREASGKAGKPVRYQVSSNGREVTLLAITL